MSWSRGPVATAAALWPMQWRSEDNVSDTSTARRLASESAETDGKTRLKYMFSTDEFGNVSAEMNSVLQVTFLGTFVGAIYGGVQQSKVAYLDFINNNQATQFKSHLEAKRQLQDRVTVTFARGAFRWGWRLGAFSALYVLTTTCVSVYRGKSGILEYLVGGFTAGGLYKMPSGPKGTVAGAALGTVLGALAGTVSLAMLKLTGTTMEEVRYWQYKFHDDRQNKFAEAVRLHKEKDDVLLLQEYNARNDKHRETHLAD